MHKTLDEAAAVRRILRGNGGPQPGHRIINHWPVFAITSLRLPERLLKAAYATPVPADALEG